MSERVRINEMLPHLALGDLTPEEEKAARDHLEVCESCREEYAKIFRVLEDLQQSLQSVPIPDPISPDALWQTFLSRDIPLRHEWMESPPALWRDVMVALNSVEAPTGLSLENIENIFERVEENDKRKKFVSFRRKLAVAVSLAAGFFMLLAYIMIGNSVFEEHRDYEASLCLIQADGARGLEIPETLPGTLRLAGGEATVQLNSGVILTLQGPAELNLKNGMFVRLYSGRLLADVPHQATGFTVRTPELEVYDLGTTFCVSTIGGISGVFVFQGSVQVNESGEWGTVTALSEAGMSICKEGEGVFKKRGDTPVRFSADNSESRKIFEQVKGIEALQNPGRAMQAARSIADSWINRYIPESDIALKNNPAANSNPAGAAAGSGLSATPGTEKTLSYSSRNKIKHFRHCANKANGVTFVGPQVPNMYFSADCEGHYSWNTVENWCFYQSCGGGFVGRLPNSNDTVRINAATLATEDGCALNIGKDVNARCYNFASGYMNYPGTACMKLNGGTLKSETTTVIGMYYPGLAILESGLLYSGTDFLIGGYGNPNGWGVVTNNGATINTLRLDIGHETGTFGRMVHNGGYLNCRAAEPDSVLQVGLNGGVGEFEANAPFSVNTMSIGQCNAASTSYGTGTVTLAKGAVGEINNLLQVENGSLFMKGGSIHLQNTNGTLTNLFVCKDADSRAVISGWGEFTCTDTHKILRMVNNGRIIADGYGVNHDLDFNLLAVINGQGESSGWYAVNKGRVLFPRTFQSFSPGTSYCIGDLYNKTVPGLVNSVSFSFSSPLNCKVRGGFCASDRSDIPPGLPRHLKPIGVWCLGAYSGKVLMKKASFSSVSLTFRYDHTKLKPSGSRLRLYRHNGNTWVPVGECEPDGSALISTDASLSPVISGDYNIGWFALMDVEKTGTVMFVF